MYPAESTRTDPDRPCFIMAATGETVTYGELNARANRLAHLFGAHGLQRGDHYSILARPTVVEVAASIERALTGELDHAH